MPRKNRHTAMPTNTASDEPNGSAAQVATRCNLQYNMQQTTGNMNVASPEPAEAAELHRDATNATNLRRDATRCNATQYVATMPPTRRNMPRSFARWRRRRRRRRRTDALSGLWQSALRHARRGGTPEASAASAVSEMVSDSARLRPMRSPRNLPGGRSSVASAQLLQPRRLQPRNAHNTTPADPLGIRPRPPAPSRRRARGPAEVGYVGAGVGQVGAG